MVLEVSRSLLAGQRRPPTWVLAAAAAANLVVLLAVGLGAALYLLGFCIAVPLVFALYRRPQRGVLLLAALVPFDGLLVVSSHASTLKGWKIVLVLATLAATFVCPPQERAQRKRRRPAWFLPLVLLLVLGGLSVVAVGLHQGSTGFRVTFFYVLLAWAVWRCPLSRLEVDRLVTILMSVAWFTSAYGLLQQGIGAARLASFGFPYNETIRTTGGHLRSFSTFEQPFPFAYFLMMVVLVCLPIALSDRSRLRNRLFLYSLPLIGAAMLFTFVRGAWLGLAVGWLYLGWRRHRALLIVIPFAVVATLYLPATLTTSAFQGTSLAQRGTGWADNLHHVIDHPLGLGIGSSGAAAQALAQETVPTPPGGGLSLVAPATYQPDNYYYNTVYQLGVLGLWFMVMLQLGAIWDADRAARRRSGLDSTLSLGVAAFLAGAIAACFVSTFFEIFPMDAYFWLFISLVAARERGVSDTERVEAWQLESS